MVLVRPIGRPRPFPLVLLFYVLTFGVYGIYWHYKAHHEVHRQFELDLEGRSEGVVWLVLDRVFFPLRWVYQYGFVQNVGHVRRRMGATRGLTAGAFLGLTIPGATLSYAALIIVFVSQSIERPDLTVLLLDLALITYLVGAALQIPAYAFLQRDINDIWRRFDARMDRLMPARPASVVLDAPTAPASWPATPASPPE